MVNRRPGSISGRRFAFVLAAALGPLAWLGPAATAAEADTQLVTAAVYTTSGLKQESVSLGALQADPQKCPPYSGRAIELHGRQGITTGSINQNTWTLGTILGCLQPSSVKLSDITSVTLVDGQGAPQMGNDSQLKPPDLGSPTDFQDQSESPLVTSLGADSTSEYDRPWRGGSDNNFSDQVQQPAGTPIAIEVFEGAGLKVTAHASPPSIPKGGSVGLSADVSPAGPSDVFSWRRDTGVLSTDPSPHVVLTDTGVVNVTVQVIDQSTGSTGSDTIPITVGQRTQQTSGQPPANTTPQGGTPPPGSKQPGAGGSPGGGGPGGRGPGGGSKGPGTGGPRHGGTHTTPGSTTPTASTPSSSTPSSTTPSSIAPASATPASGSSPTAGAGASTPRTTVHGHAGRSPFRSPLKSAVPGTGGTQAPLVTGRLVSDVIPIPARVSPLVHPASPSAGLAGTLRSPGGAPVLPVLTGSIVILLLLGLGAARELRNRGDWRALRFGS